MTGAAEMLDRTEIRKVRGERILCAMNRVLPLGRKYHPLLGALNGRHGLLASPFDRFRLIRPAAWSKSITTQLVLGPAPEFQLLRPVFSQLAQGFLIDAGANIGAYTLFFRTASRQPIIAYEPLPLLFRLLRLNIAYNELADVQARNIACGATRGETAFWTGLNGSVVPEASPAARETLGAAAPAVGDWDQEARIAQAGAAVIKVPVTALDEDLADIASIALLKIDCEGFEYQILQGARELLKRHRPILFVEVHPEQLEVFGDSTRALLDLLLPAYELEFWYFQIGRHRSKLARSMAKFRKPKGHQCANAAEMLAAATSAPGPAQIYFLGRPR